MTMLELETPVEQEDWWGESASDLLTYVEEEPGPVSIDHVVDYYNRYPGEVVTFFTKITVHEQSSDLTLRILLPEGFIVGDYQAPAERAELHPLTEVGISAGHRTRTSTLVWRLDGRLEAGTDYEFKTEAVLAPMPYDTTLTSRARVTDENDELLSEGAVKVMVQAKGSYLRYLPSIYERDDLMGRFLMLFESFWSPVEKQIEGIHHYFDPRITPASFLPWLASWLDVELDERWQEARLRRLLRWAIALHRSRGTKWGLLKYLEIYTGRQAEIIERRARNFVLSAEARLGPGIALGRGNVPHTFTVNLRLPPLEARRKKERERLEEIRRRTIESIIEMQKPAHTVYTLNIGLLDDEEGAGSDEAEETTTPAKSEQDEISAQAAIWFKLDD